MFHDGMRALQEEFDGRRTADALEARRRHRDFWPEEVALITETPFFFIATGHAQAMDCSYRGGAPGFVQVTGAHTLEWPEYDGNSMYRTLGNLTQNPRVGLLFMRFDGVSLRIRMTGNAQLLRDAATLSRHHAARAVVRFEADYVYPNCPRYIPAMSLAEQSRFNPTPGHTPPPPEWKSRDYIRDTLPRDDPHRGME